MTETVRRRVMALYERLPGGRRDHLALLAVIVLGVIIRGVVVVATSDTALGGDAIEYDIEGRFAADGKFLWSTTPYGIPHESMWKAPGYTAWVGFWYWLLGAGSYVRVAMVQVLTLGPLVIGLIWLLGTRLFDKRVGLVAAVIAAVYPFLWLSQIRLFSESIALPILLVGLLLVLGVDGPPSTRRALAVGAAGGALLLTRPTWAFVLVAAAGAWMVAAGWWRGVRATALTALAALAIVTPWTIRNAIISDGEFVPISVQDAAAYGTFNDDAANDKTHPWAWRQHTTRDADLFDPGNPLPEAELRSALRERAVDYIADHPESLPKAYFWNGFVRLWDPWIPGVFDHRSPDRVADQLAVQGKPRPLILTSVAMYYVLLPAALAGLWINRRRLSLMVPVGIMVIVGSVLVIPVGNTRYREGFEPLIAVFASMALVAAVDWWRTRAQPRPVGQQVSDPPGRDLVADEVGASS